jgi:S-formylglutathione hydrolase FrmB
MTSYRRFRSDILILLGFSGLFSGCHRGEPLRLDHPRLIADVAMSDITFRSTALDREMTYRVFLPAKIDAGQKLPVVYLLHGNGGGYRDWSNNSDVARYAAKGLILVMSEGHGSYFMNAVERPRDKYEDYLIRDLVADVESRFPARAGRGSRALVGVSMGGFAAIELGLRHPEMFAFAGAISPAIDVPERRFSWKRAGQWWKFRTIFGSLGSKERQARDPFVLVQSADPATVPYFYLTAGEQEPLLEPIRRFAARLGQRGFAHEFHTRPGGHDWMEWNAQIPGCFASLSQRLPTGSSK